MGPKRDGGADVKVVSPLQIVQVGVSTFLAKRWETCAWSLCNGCLSIVRHDQKVEEN